MQRKKYTEEQIIQVLKEGEAGTPVSELCRKYGISDASYYNWKAKYAGLSVSELKRLKALEEENHRLDRRQMSPRVPGKNRTHLGPQGPGFS